MVSTRISIALLRQDWAAVAPLTAQLRAMQDKPGPKHTSGVLSELIAQMKRDGKGADALQGAVTQRFAALPWAEVQDSVKAMKGQLEIASPSLVIGSVRAQADEAARNANRVVDDHLVAGLIGARAQLDHLLPMRQAIVAGLAPVIAKQVAAAPAKPDRWSERLVALPPTAPANWPSCSHGLCAFVALAVPWRRSTCEISCAMTPTTSPSDAAASNMPRFTNIGPPGPPAGG